MKTIKVKHIALERKEVEKEYVLTGEKLFVHTWNFREVIGIYPRSYDYGSGNTGYVYNVRVGIRTMGSPTVVMSFDIPDNAFLEMHDRDSTIASLSINPEMTKWIRRTFAILCRDTDYDTKIDEKTFTDYYSAMIGEMTMDRWRIQFQYDADHKVE